MTDFPETPPPDLATERLLSTTFTGRPIEIGHAALRRLIESADGILVVGDSDIELQRDGKTIATLAIYDTKTWNAFAADIGVPG